MKKNAQGSISDLLKLGEAALSVLLGAGGEMKSAFSDKRDSLVRHLDLVTREEFDAAFAMIKKARQMQGDLDKRLTKLEAKTTLSRGQKPARKKTIPPKR